MNNILQFHLQDPGRRRRRWLLTPGSALMMPLSVSDTKYLWFSTNIKNMYSLELFYCEDIFNRFYHNSFLRYHRKDRFRPLLIPGEGKREISILPETRFYDLYPKRDLTEMYKYIYIKRRKASHRIHYDYIKDSAILTQGYTSSCTFHSIYIQYSPCSRFLITGLQQNLHIKYTCYLQRLFHYKPGWWITYHIFIYRT